MEETKVVGCVILPMIPSRLESDRFTNADIAMGDIAWANSRIIFEPCPCDLALPCLVYVRLYTVSADRS